MSGSEVKCPFFVSYTEGGAIQCNPGCFEQDFGYRVFEIGRYQTFEAGELNGEITDMHFRRVCARDWTECDQARLMEYLMETYEDSERGSG